MELVVREYPDSLVFDTPRDDVLKTSPKVLGLDSFSESVDMLSSVADEVVSLFWYGVVVVAVEGVL